MPCGTQAAVRFCSDGSGEFAERGRDAAMGSGFDAEFVVTATNVLHQRVTAHDREGDAVTFESTHRPKSRLFKRPRSASIRLFAYRSVL